jgi:FkbM family methyltransferase
VTHAANHGVHVYNCCVGNEIGETKLFLGENPTIDRDTVVKQPWCEYDENNFIIVPVVTLDAMLSNEEAIVADFDLLVIDVEGAELQVLEGINLEEWRPHMIIIETHDGNVDSRKSFHADAIKKHMSSQPYVQVQCDGLNTVYIRQV